MSRIVNKVTQLPMLNHAYKRMDEWMKFPLHDIVQIIGKTNVTNKLK